MLILERCLGCTWSRSEHWIGDWNQAILCRSSLAHKVYRVSSYVMHLLQSNVMAVVVNHRLLKLETRVRFLASLMCGFSWMKGHWDKLYSEYFYLYGVTIFLEPDIAGCISDFVNIFLMYILRNTSLISGQSVLDLWWTSCHWHGVSLSISIFLC